jgi:hypothetical protein
MILCWCGEMQEVRYGKMFAVTAFAAWWTLLAYVGWAVFRAWPESALGPLWAESDAIVGVNVALAAGLIGLVRIGVAAARNGDLW